MREKDLETIKELGYKIGHSPYAIDEALKFIEKYRMSFMGKTARVVASVVYWIVGFICKEPHTWHEIITQTGCTPYNIWKIHGELLDANSEKLKKLKITKDELSSRVRVFMLHRHINSPLYEKEKEEISKLFKEIFY